jgi:hypothetical protein
LMIFHPLMQGNPPGLTLFRTSRALASMCTIGPATGEGEMNATLHPPLR